MIDRIGIRLASLVWIGVISPIAMFAQVNATVGGTVADTTGALIP